MVDDVKILHDAIPLSAYAYFYFDSRSAEKGLSLYQNFVRSILTQLAYRCNGIPAALQDLYRKHGDGREQPSLAALHETLQLVINGFDHVYIVVDSLDECGERSELLRYMTAPGVWQSPNLHLLVTSRPEPEIRTQLGRIRHLKTITIEVSVAQRDIEMYLDARLAEITRWSKATQDRIKKKLMENVDGMWVITNLHLGISDLTTDRFRWIALQLEELTRCFNIREVNTQLDALPKDLEEAYERILTRSTRPKELLQLLCWLAFSARTLSLEQFAEVVSVDLEADGRPTYDVELKYGDASVVLTVCEGLITETDGKSFQPIDRCFTK